MSDHPTGRQGHLDADLGPMTDLSWPSVQLLAFSMLFHAQIPAVEDYYPGTVPKPDLIIFLPRVIS